MPFMEATAKQSEIDRFSLFPNDVVITKDSESADDIGIPTYIQSIRENLLCGYHLTILRPKKNVDGRFLSLTLTHPRISYDFYRYANGITRFGLTTETYSKVKIPLPPVPEQKAIAALLSTWDEAIEKIDRLIQAKKRGLNALYQRYFRTNSEIAKGWKSVKIGKFVTPRNEKAVPTEKQPLYSLTIENGVTEKTERYNREFLVKDTGNKTYKVVHPGDIVFNPANLRWGAIARSTVDHRVVLSPIYEVLQINEDAINSDFLTHALTCPRQVAIYATKTEGTLIERMAVKLDAFLLLKIRVPISISEQKEVADTLSSARHEIDLLKQLADKYKTQKRGLMQKMLTGEWRVKPEIINQYMEA
jgi:type I restriction enzyme S subunit